jgi:hypothetical protein
VIVSQNKLAKLSSADKATMTAAFNRHEPVVLLSPTKQEVLKLQAILGVGELGYHLPEGVKRTVIYALDKEKSGDTFVWVQYPLADSSVANAAAANEYQARILQQFLLRDGYRSHDIKPSVKLEAAANSPENELTEIAKGFIDQRNWVDMRCKNMPCNHYQISHFIYAVHSIDSGEDWYYVQQRGMFNMSNEYKSTWGGAVRDNYMHQITMDTDVDGYIGDPKKVGLIQSSPDTDTSSRTVTSGVTYSLSGNVSLSKKGSGVAVTGGVSISNSTSVKVEDVTVVNQSFFNDTATTEIYTFSQCTKKCDFVIPVCDHVPELAVSTFSPMNQWIWRMDPEVRKKTAGMNVKASWQLVSSSVVLHLPWVCSIDHRPTSQREFSYRINLPFPPIKK